PHADEAGSFPQSVASLPPFHGRKLHDGDFGLGLLMIELAQCQERSHELVRVGSDRRVVVETNTMVVNELRIDLNGLGLRRKVPGEALEEHLLEGLLVP